MKIIYSRKLKKFKIVEELSELYDRGYFHGDAYDDYSFERFKSSFLGKMKIVKKFHKERGRLLDVGCALGFFVKIAQDEGFDAFGVDFSKYAIGEAKKLLDDKVSCVDVEKEIPFPDSYFDVITAWDILEHLKNPGLFIERASRVLKKHGLIFIRTLNYNCLMARLMRKSWLQMGAEHVTYTITIADLKNWLQKCGLREVKIYTIDIALKPLPDKIRVIEKLLYFPIHTLGLRLLRPLNLGDDIVCVAKKELVLS